MTSNVSEHAVGWLTLYLSLMPGGRRGLTKLPGALSKLGLQIEVDRTSSVLFLGPAYEWLPNSDPI